jgi:electron transfer flavoprotein alpha subunit
MTKILVIIENAKGKIVGITKECITAANNLDAELEGVILGQDIGELAAEATKYGINKIYKIDDSQFAGVIVLYHTRTLEALIKQVNPDIIMAGASLYGQEVMPRLAARFNSAMFPSVKEIKIDNSEIEAIHPLFEEKLFAKMEADMDHPNFITVLGGNNPEAEINDSLSGDIVDFPSVIEDSDKREVFVEESC